MIQTSYTYGPGAYREDGLLSEIAAAGLPAPIAINGSGASRIGAPAARVAVIFADVLPAAQQAQLGTILSLHDATGATTAAVKAAAKLALLADGPDAKAERNFVRALRAYLVTLTNKINELVAFSNTKGATIAPLTAPTWAQVLAAVRSQIDSESDPST